MRIAIFLLILGILQAHAVDAYSQKTRLSLDFTDTELIKVLDNIEVESEFFFLYNEKLLDTDRKVNIAENDQLINVILDNLFAGTDVKYTIIDRKIILAPDYLTKETDETKYLQQQIVTGTVTDNQTGEPLAGVNIMIKGTTVGTNSDSNGKYSLSSGSDPNAILVFSFIGYKTLEVPCEGRMVISVNMEGELTGLDEVVVIGYGTVKKATITGAISTVEGEQLQKSPAINISNSFTGRLPGLLVVTRSGEPGNDESILRIRGSNTLGNNNPLVVIDGIANRDMNRINPYDIESITVLKDASAAIYGAQAANGVILITTKRGVEGKPQITVNLNQGWSMPTVLPEMADAATYAQLINEINSYDGNPPKFSEEQIQKYRDGSDPLHYPNTDWYAATMKNAAAQNYANFELRGGTQAMKYFVSIGANFQDGIYKNSATNYKQANFRTNIDGRINENIKLSVDIAGRQEIRNYPTRSASSVFSMLMRGYPIQHAFWPNGLPGPDIANGDNPVVITTSQTGYDKTKDYIMESVLKLDVNIPWIKGLSFSGNASFDKNIRNNKLWEIPWYLYTWDGVTMEGDQPDLQKAKRGLPSPQLTQYFSDGSRTTINALLTYDTKIGEDHNLKVLVGSERIYGESMNFEAFRKYFVSNVVDQLFAGSELEKDNDGSASVNARLNYFGRMNYAFRDKYMMEFVFRYDGSYIFPAGKRFGFFPGVSAGWRISEENFWKNNVNFMNYFKLRGSWGQTGNDRIETYQYLSSYGFASTSYVFGNEEKILNELRIPNPDVTWEVANQLDIGFDAAMLNSKLNFQADYFYNLRTNILWRRNASVPLTSGLSLPRENIGEVANRGFDFQVSYHDKFGNVDYNVSVNGGYQKNEIMFWDETPGVPEYQKSTGHPMNASLQYEAIGIFVDDESLNNYPHWQGARAGDIIFRDANKDDKIDGLDRVRYDKTDLPTFSGGFNLDVRCKSFYASAFFQGAAGAVRDNYYEFNGESGNFLKEDTEGRWTVDNPSTTKPRAWNRYFGYWREQDNTYWLKSTDYIRLKNLEIGYDVSSLRVIKEMGISNFRVYFTSLNLFTLDKLKDFDPESTSANSYPLNKVFNVGASLTF